jgi:hypothetical protein
MGAKSEDWRSCLMAKIFLSYSVQDAFDLAQKIEKGLGNTGSPHQYTGRL